MSNWFEELKVGDEVVLDMSLHSKLQIQKITKVTPKQIVVGSMRFWRNDGTGTERNGGYRPSLLMPTPEIRDTIRRNNLAGYITSKANKLTMLPIPLLEMVARSLKVLRD